MVHIFSLVGYIFSYAMKLAGFLNLKVRLILSGRKQTISTLQRFIDPQKETIWFHVASLGEFEQGRPLIESLRNKCPDTQFVLSFFSSSGYEVRKNYEIVDAVVYIPRDTIKDVSLFLNTIQPNKVFFIKYDIWPVFLNELHRRKIPTYLVSAIFRESQLFFKNYGKWYLNILRYFTKIFVQDLKSKDLLYKYDINNVFVSGDTRFDRVIEISKNSKDIKAVQNMISDGSKLLVIGSSWQEDEMIYIPYLNNHHNIKVVIAPHELSLSRVNYIKQKIKRPIMLLSDFEKNNGNKEYDCLVIDSFGLLSSIYKYADIVYIGGGFGKGIHNTLEAAVYGKPIILGPNNKKFLEAQDLLTRSAAIEINGIESFNTNMDRLLSDDSLCNVMGESAKQYVLSKGNVIDKILKEL